MYPETKAEEENSPAAIGGLVEHIIEYLEKVSVEEMVGLMRSVGVTGSNTELREDCKTVRLVLVGQILDQALEKRWNFALKRHHQSDGQAKEPDTPEKGPDTSVD